MKNFIGTMIKGMALGIGTFIGTTLASTIYKKNYLNIKRIEAKIKKRK